MASTRKSPKVLLVYPNIWSDVFPLSLLILSAVLREQNCDVEVFSAVYRRRINSTSNPCVEEGVRSDTFNDFRETVEHFQPDLIAFSVVEDAFLLTCQLLDCMGRFDGLVLMGGVFPTFAPSKAISHPRVDAICIGEGENVLAAIVENIAVGKNVMDVAGLWVKGPDRQIKKNPPPKVVNLDRLPPPDYSIIKKQQFPGPVPIIAHRGCPYPCSFCNSPAQARLLNEKSSESYFRKQSIAVLRRDLETLVRDHTDKVTAQGLYFCSDTLLAWSQKEFDEFAEMYSDFQLPFICHTTAETVSYERVKKLKDLGLRLMNIGVQHGNEIFRRDVLRRRMSNKALLSRLAMASDAGAFVSVDFIVGFPGETFALAQDTLAFSQKVKASVRNCSIFVPYHGTELRKIAEERGYIDPATLAVWCPEESQLTMSNFTKKEIRQVVEEFKAVHTLVGGVA